MAAASFFDPDNSGDKKIERTAGQMLLYYLNPVLLNQRFDLIKIESAIISRAHQKQRNAFGIVFQMK